MQIKDLLARFKEEACEYSLKEVVHISTGTVINKKEIEANPGVYPVINSGKDPLGFYNKWNTEDDPISVTSRGVGAGYVSWNEGKFFRGSLSYSLKVLDEAKVFPKYLYYALKASYINIDKIVVKSGAIPALNKSALQEITVLIPSLEVQKEMVEILEEADKSHCSLVLSIPKGIDLSKKSFYTSFEELFKFKDIENRSDIKEISVDSLFNIKSGYTPSKKNEAFWTNGTVPWFRMEDIRANGRKLDSSIQLVAKEAVKGGRLIPANSLIMAISATIGEHALIKIPFISNQRFACFTLKDEYKDSIDIMYLYYFFFEFAEWCKYNATKGGTMDAITLATLKEFKIPVPYFGDKEKSLAKQREIIDILEESESKHLLLTESFNTLHTKEEKAFKSILHKFFSTSNNEPIVV